MQNKYALRCFRDENLVFSAEVQWLWSSLSLPKGITDLEWMMEHKVLDWLSLIYRQASSGLWGKMILAIFDYFFIARILYSASALRLFSRIHFCKLGKINENRWRIIWFLLESSNLWAKITVILQQSQKM